jgi:hypothetical protein
MKTGELVRIFASRSDKEGVLGFADGFVRRWWFQRVSGTVFRNPSVEPILEPILTIFCFDLR